MSESKSFFSRYASILDERFDGLMNGVKGRLNLHDPLQIVPYRSYGAANRLYVKGRVLEDKGIAKYTDKDTILNNLVNMYKRFESDEVPGAQVKMSFEGKEMVVTTDREGYFIINLVPT